MCWHAAGTCQEEDSRQEGCCPQAQEGGCAQAQEDDCHQEEGWCFCCKTCACAASLPCSMKTFREVLHFSQHCIVQLIICSKFPARNILPCSGGPADSGSCAGKVVHRCGHNMEMMSAAGCPKEGQGCARQGLRPGKHPKMLSCWTEARCLRRGANTPRQPNN